MVPTLRVVVGGFLAVIVISAFSKRFSDGVTVSIDFPESTMDPIGTLTSVVPVN